MDHKLVFYCRATITFRNFTSSSFLINNVRAQGFCERMLLQWDIKVHGGKTWSANDRLELIEASIEGSIGNQIPIIKRASPCC